MRIAVVDDEPRMGEVLAMVLRRDGHAVTVFAAGEAFLAADGPFDLVLTDLKMPGIDGMEVLRRARAADPSRPVIVVTAHGSVPSAVAALHEGAFDYLQKPVDNDACRAAVRRALAQVRLTRENTALRAALDDGRGEIVAESAAMRAVLDLARRAAPSRATVLVTGESGTGKERIARVVHACSDRVAGPFEAVNCKALAGGVLESELFGHERGAFTGAERARPGLFERAHGGTVFLDEVGEVDPDWQAKILRVLQEGEVQRVGGAAPRKVDIRVVAATNRDLAAEVAAGRFREDLYYRLAVIPLHIPPLRERRADVLPLARAFLARHQSRVRGWSDEVERWLVAHDWPGNVRELQNAVERGAVLARGERIELEDLLVAGPGPAPGGRTLQAAMDEAAVRRIREALAETGGQRQEAAARLGVDRTTLFRLLRKYGIEA